MDDPLSSVLIFLFVDASFAADTSLNDSSSSWSSPLAIFFPRQHEMMHDLEGASSWKTLVPTWLVVDLWCNCAADIKGGIIIAIQMLEQQPLLNDTK